MKIIISIISILLIITSFVAFTSMTEHRQLKNNILQQEHAQEVNKSLYKLKMTNWAFKNSERIAYVTAKEIIDEALKVNHSILVLSVISVESQFNPSAVSYKGAIGLGQIMYGHWGKDLEKLKIIKDKRDLFGIKENLMATSYILDLQMKQANGDVVKALKFYLGESQSRYTNKIFTSYVSLSALRD